MRENSRLKEVFSEIHNLNHLYRQTLAGTSAKLLNSSDDDQRNSILLSAESDTLKNVVHIISETFSQLVGRKVTVTVWFYRKSTDTCKEFMCSEDGTSAIRDRFPRDSYDVSENDYFSKCLDRNGSCSHFLENDIPLKRKKDGFSDQRPNAEEIYQAIMVVPIRFVQRDDEDRIGYLQIDLKSRNRLNDVEHLFLLSAYADQLYNFHSLVRRNFLYS